MPPVVARLATSAVHPVTTTAEAKAFSQLQESERRYVCGLKRKERNELVNMIAYPKVPRLETPLRMEVLRCHLPQEMRMEIFDELGRNHGEKYVNWVRRLIKLPLNVLCHTPSFGPMARAMEEARRVMDSTITGHADAKLEVLKLLCQSHSNGGSCASNYSLGFEGPPGTGKTHFVRTALASALRRPLVSIPLGGATDVGYLLGHLYVYEGSKEGRLASALVEAKCCNPIIHFDEVDKISTTERGAELVGVLIHLVDPTANTRLRDRYFHNVDIDYSRCTFVFSYNDPTRVSPILLDRIKRVSMPVPTSAERRSIVREHLIPRVQKRLNTTIDLSEAATECVLEDVGESGMRETERRVDHVMANAHLCCACNDQKGSMVRADVGVLDGDKNVSGEFARRMLASRDVASDSTPLQMYL